MLRILSEKNRWKWWLLLKSKLNKNLKKMNLAKTYTKWANNCLILPTRLRKKQTKKMQLECKKRPSSKLLPRNQFKSSWMPRRHLRKKLRWNYNSKENLKNWLKNNKKKNKRIKKDASLKNFPNSLKWQKHWLKHHNLRKLLL